MLGDINELETNVCGFGFVKELLSMTQMKQNQNERLRRRGATKQDTKRLGLVFIELAFFFSGGVLVLLVLGHQVVHVRLGFSELHFVHALTGVPVEKGLAAEHGSELLSHALPHLLHGGGVAHEGVRHLQALRRDVADGSLHVVRDTLHEVR